MEPESPNSLTYYETLTSIGGYDRIQFGYPESAN
jgi:hypothetical protein